jgi:GTP-binding protein HflX
MISAVKNEGIDRLLEVIEDSLPKTKARAILLVPFSEGHILGELRKTGVVYSESYKENGTQLDALVDIDYLEKIKRYIVSM